MLRALYTSASGMQGQQMNLDVIANNLANVNTTAFKKSRADFEDLYYQKIRTGSGQPAAGPGFGIRRLAEPGTRKRAVSSSLSN